MVAYEIVGPTVAPSRGGVALTGRVAKITARTTKGGSVVGPEEIQVAPKVTDGVVSYSQGPEQVTFKKGNVVRKCSPEGPVLPRGALCLL